MSYSSQNENIFKVKSMYLGSEPMGELLEGESGSDVIQVPLKRTIMRTNGYGRECLLSVTNDSLEVAFTKTDKSNSNLKLPIELLAYCGALRQLPNGQIRTREFETLDKFPANNDEASPPLFVTIFRSLDNENTLYCHSFVIKQDDDAMELVKLVMEMYYNLIRLNDSEDENDTTNNDKNFKTNLNKNFSSSSLSLELELENITNGSKNNDNIFKNSTQHMNDLFDIYQKIPQISNDKSVISAKDLIKQSIESNEYRMHLQSNSDDKYGDVPLNEDDDPIIIKRENNEQIVYKQNVFIRWLQPPTPPPPAPIIIREVQEPASEQLPPLVIYKQAPRPPTPPPLIIRERPPSPFDVPREPLIIERRVAMPEKHRKVIIEHLPAPPAKPRDIILEKWIPREPAQRQIYVQKANQIGYHRPAYDNNEKSYQNHRPRKDLYEILDTPRQYNKVKHSHSARSNSNETSHQSYSTANNIDPLIEYYGNPQLKKQTMQQQQKIAGYRIIRQIIPGPNTTSADIEKALARSKPVSSKVYSNHKLYSPSFEAHGTSYNHKNIVNYDHRNQNLSYSSSSKQNNNLYFPSSNSASGSASGQYSALQNHHPSHKSRQLFVQQSYSPTNHHVYNSHQNQSNQPYKPKREIYRSSSIDNF